VRLPRVVSSAPQRQGERGCVLSDLNGLRVLAVDDIPDSLDLMRVILERCGATVVVAASAEMAFEIFQRESIDVVVSDISMPGRDGYWLMEQLRLAAAAMERRIAGVAISGLMRNNKARALACGFNDFLQKPVEPAEVCERVAAVARV
jgi:CheY-like chemotaxis protein